MKKLFTYFATVVLVAVFIAPASVQAEEEKGFFKNNSFFSGKKKEEKKVESEAEVKKVVREAPKASSASQDRSVNSVRGLDKRPSEMTDEERKVWREKRRAEIEEMRKNMPPPKELTAAEKAERKAKREKRRAEIEKMRANMPPPKELTAAEKAEREARRKERRAKIEKMRAEAGN